LKKHLKADKAKTKVGGITKFGLMEMSRQRIKHAITFGSYEACKHCKGRGQIPSVETQGLAILRQLNLKALKAEIKELKAVVPKEVAIYLLNRKREELIEIELKRDIIITIEGDSNMFSGEINTFINN
jgi:ribonuclease E